MTTVYSRMVGWLLLGLTAVIMTWGLDLRDANVVAQRAAREVQAQLVRAQARAITPASVAVGVEPGVSGSEVSAWREAAKSHGSDARNAAAMLQRAKEFCAVSGLKDCQIRRSSLRTAGANAGNQLMPVTVNILARFDAQGVDGLSRQLDASGLLYRLERVNIVQNRAEWDITFFTLSGDSSFAREVAKP